MRKGWFVLVLGAAVVGWVVAGQRAERSRERQGRVYSAVSVQGELTPLAGMSAVGNIRVRRLSERKLGADRDSPDYHRYLNRCGACHAPPDPGLHRQSEWPAVIDRMHANMRSAGTLGLHLADRDAIYRFLGRHAPK